MAIWGGLFDKKVCSICGGEIGLLGNRKLEDGNLCKNCASRLSPRLADRRGSTVEEIRQHLAWRDHNYEELQSIRPTRVFGSRMRVYLDDNAGKFFVTASTRWQNENPDLIELAQVISCTPKVVEHRHELYHHDREGHRVPFNPPRYEYDYEFRINLQIDSPWYNEIDFELTDSRPKQRLSQEFAQWEQQAAEIVAALTAPAPAQVVSTVSPGDPGAWTCACGTVHDGKFCISCGKPRPAAEPVQAAAPAGDSWTCSCGAVNTGRFCPNCGKARPEKPKVFRCDKCGWTPDDPANPPKFCPNCGDPFNASDAVDA